MSTALTKARSAGGAVALPSMMDPEIFGHMVRVGKVLGMSPLFPDHLRKGGPDVAAANGVLVLNIANRLNEDVLTVAQNIYFVSGKPGWSATYIIAKANQHGVFKGRIKWRTHKDYREKGNLAVEAYATLAEDGSEVSAICDMDMAKKEGWTSNKKYQTMPEVMLTYRSATFLIRKTCPEVMLGIPVADEVEDTGYSGMRDVTPTAGPDLGSAPDLSATADLDPKPQPEADPEPEPDQEKAGEPALQDTRDDGSDADAPTDAELEGIRDHLMSQMFDGMSLDKVLAEFADDVATLEQHAPVYLDQVKQAG